MFRLSRMTASAWLRARCVSSGCRKHLETSRSRKTMQQITSKDDWKILFGEHRGRPVWHYVIQLRSPVSLAQPCSTHSQPEKWILNLRQLLDKLLQYSTCVSVWQWKPANLFWVFFSDLNQFKGGKTNALTWVNRLNENRTHKHTGIGMHSTTLVSQATFAKSKYFVHRVVCGVCSVHNRIRT